MIVQVAPILFHRQRRLLALLDELGGAAKNLDFQKILFLYCQETPGPPVYDFVPYKYGAFSFTCYADRRKLVQHGLIEGDEQTWRLTESGRRAAKDLQGSDAMLRRFVRQWEGLRGDALVAETYRRYPYYGTRSEIARKILRKDPETWRRIEAASPVRGVPGIATIGYEGRSLESYLNELLKSGVTLLCDIRRNPLSRKYGFSKGTLSKGCEGVGIRYEHLPDLGIASEQRRNLETQADYDHLFREYEHKTLPAKVPALLRIRDWVSRGERVALTCYERLPAQCHRHCIAEALEAQFGAGLAATHL